MRSVIPRALVGAAVAASAFGGLGTTTASADPCEHNAYVGEQRIGWDGPTEGAVGVVFVCLEGPVTCFVGGGVHVYNPGDGWHADPVVYKPCDGAQYYP